MNIVDLLIMLELLIFFPVGIYIFGGKKMTWTGLEDMVDKYRYHLMIYIGIFLGKVIVNPLEQYFEKNAINFTNMIYGFEGNTIFWVQHYFESFPLTFFMAIIYIGSFLYIMTFSLLFFSYMDMKKAASKLAFMYIVLLALTIPFYLFVLVYVPSYPKMFYPGAESVITGMEPLLYNFGPNVNEFFVSYDTFNNCFPSMHIGYPSAILMLTMLNVRGYRLFKIFLFTMLCLIAFSIIYLGIHWLTDIAGGLLIAAVGVMIAEKYAFGFWKWVARRHRWLKKKYDALMEAHPRS